MQNDLTCRLRISDLQIVRRRTSYSRVSFSSFQVLHRSNAVRHFGYLQRQEEEKEEKKKLK